MNFDDRDTYFTQSTSFDDEGSSGTIKMMKRDTVRGRRQFVETEGELLARSGPIQVGPSEAMYLEYGLVRQGDVLSIAYQAKDALAKWSGWELSEELGPISYEQGVKRLNMMAGKTDDFSAAGRGTVGMESESR